MMRSVVLAITAGLIACPAPSLPVEQASAFPSLNRAVAAANADLSDPSLTWRPLERAEVLGRRFEAFRLGDTGPRFVWIPTEGEAVSVQTWVRHHRRGDNLAPPALLEAVVIALSSVEQTDQRALRFNVGRDQSRLNVRSLAGPSRWADHIAAHADLLCRATWTDEQLSQALAQVGRNRGWARVAERLSRRAWRARFPGRTVPARSAQPSPEKMRWALQAWLRPADGDTTTLRSWNWISSTVNSAIGPDDLLQEQARVRDADGVAAECAHPDGAEFRDRAS